MDGSPHPCPHSSQHRLSLLCCSFVASQLLIEPCVLSSLPCIAEGICSVLSLSCLLDAADSCPWGESRTAMETDPKPNKFLLEVIRSQCSGGLEQESRIRGLGIWEWGRCAKDGGTGPYGPGREQQVQSLGGGHVPDLLPRGYLPGSALECCCIGHVPVLPTARDRES